MEKKILCIDDQYDGEKYGKPSEKNPDNSLGGWLHHIFGNEYSLLLEKEPEKAYELIKTDENIEVVLLDIEFDGDPLGRVIAKNILDLRPDIKIVVLTTVDERGRRISLNQLKNIWYYFIKADLATDIGSDHLYGIVRGLLEDPYNEKWEVDFAPEDKRITIRHNEYGVEEHMTFKNDDQLNTIGTCLLDIGKCVDIVEIPEKSDNYGLSRVVNAVNDRIIRASGYRTWGILNSRICAKGAVKIFLGSSPKNEQVDYSPSVLEEVEALKKYIIDLEKRVVALEAK